MQHTRFGIAARLADDELLRRLQLLASGERELTVDLVTHLAELDTRGLHLAQGYASLFSYCTAVLRLAEHAAYNRIEAARASRKYPAILDRLADGRLNLSTLRLLAPHLTSDNCEAVLGEAAGKSKREVEALVARLAPRPDVLASVRKLPTPRLSPRGLATPSRATLPDEAPATDGEPAPTVAAPSATPRAAVPGATPNAEAHAAAATPHGSRAPAEADEATSSRPVPHPAAATSVGRHVVAPLSPERYRVQFTVSRETQENLRRAQELLRREVPDGDPGAIFDRALKLLLSDVARKKLAEVEKPRPVGATAAGSRYVPAHVRRSVWQRDAGQCAFVSPTGRRCRERAFLEFHHVEPYAMGGESSVANLSLRCRAHNAHEAREVFGRCAPLVRKDVRANFESNHRARQLAPGRVGEVGGTPSPGRSGDRLGLGPAAAT
jgi:hypothetical protein